MCENTILNLFPNSWRVKDNDFAQLFDDKTKMEYTFWDQATFRIDTI